MAVMASEIALGLGGSLILGGLAAQWWDVAHPGAVLKGWQFAFLVAAAPGFVLAMFLWGLREPTRGVMDGIATPPDPRPFAASPEMLGAVPPGFPLLLMPPRQAGAAMIPRHLVLTALIIAAMLPRHTASTPISPRPPPSVG